MNRSDDGMSRRKFLASVGGGATVLAGATAAGARGNKAKRKKEASASAKGGDGLTFAVVSDIHFDVLGESVGTKRYKRTLEITEWVVEELNKDDAIDLVVVPGDLLRDGEVTNVDLLRELLDRLRMPYRVIFGNHDYAPPGKPGVSKATFARAFAARGMGDTEYFSAEDFGPLRFVFLDTSATARVNGHMGHRQLEWLREELQSSDRPVIVVQHHQLIAYNEHDETPSWRDTFFMANPQPLLELYEATPQVKMVIHGHHHMGAVKTVNGIHHCSMHAVCSYPPRWWKFDVRGNKASYASHSITIDGLEEEMRQAVIDQNSFVLPNDTTNKEGMLAVLAGGKDAEQGTLTFRKG